MSGSQEILVVGGVLAVAFGMLLGFPLGRARAAAPVAPRHLVNTHLEGLIGGAVLLGLSVAAGYSTLPRGLELAAAWLLVVGVAMSLAGGSLNWLAKVDDAFAARSHGFYLQAASGPLMALGGVLLAAGAIKTAV